MVSRTPQARSCSTARLESNLAKRGADLELIPASLAHSKQCRARARGTQIGGTAVPQRPQPRPLQPPWPGTHTKGCLPSLGLMQRM